MKILVSKIHVNQIRINQEVGVSSKKKSDLNFPKCPNVDIQIVCTMYGIAQNSWEVSV